MTWYPQNNTANAQSNDSERLDAIRVAAAMRRGAGY